MVRFPSFVTSSKLTTPGWNSRLLGGPPAKWIPRDGNLDSNDLSWRALLAVDLEPIRDHSPFNSEWLRWCMETTAVGELHRLGSST